MTTFNAAGYEQSGRRMIDTWAKHWPADVSLMVYTEGCRIDAPDDRVSQRQLERSLWLSEFKERHANAPRAHGRGHGRGGYDFKFDAVKFAHKVAAYTEEAMARPADVLIWMDADTITHAKVTTDWLTSLWTPGAYIAWLNRTRQYPECGFFMLNCRHRRHERIILDVVALYTTDAIFDLPEWHDSFVLQQVIEGWRNTGEMTVGSLSGDAASTGHPFVNGPLGSRMDHLKGPRKAEGRSRMDDLRNPRSEAYWR
ncbi:MAG: hypothetical protein ACK53W_12680 [Gemmatimonadota bacterium]